VSAPQSTLPAPLLATRALAVGHQGTGVALPDLRMTPGDAIVVLGPNGSGKTTLFRTLLGVLAPRAGRVVWSGQPIGQLDARSLARAVAYVPQGAQTAFDLSVQEYVLLGRLGRLNGFSAPGPQDHAAARRAIDTLGLEAYAARPLSQMSGGERQLAAIARALAQEATVILLDEPTAALDGANQVRVLSALARLAQAGQGVIYSTHDPNHALMLGSGALLLAGAAGSRFGPVAEVLTPQALSLAYGTPLDEALTAAGRRVLAWALPRS
jgi:iron complex transport system ATP-binding protein